MPLKLKLSTAGKASSPTAGTPPPPPPGTGTPAPLTGTSTSGFKIKFKSSQPPTPATEYAPLSNITVAPLGPPPTPKPKSTATGSARSNKRAADGDISPAPKRAAPDTTGPARRISFKLSTSGLGLNDVGPDAALETPTSAASSGPRIKLGHSKSKSSTSKKSGSGAWPKAITLTTKRRPPPRPVGVGYDSEASDAEVDPAIEQQFVLRMPDPITLRDSRAQESVRADTTYVREAIANRKMGLPMSEGGADITFRFVTRDLRRAIVTIRGRKYAAALVELPCIIESMKSWDRKGGWWKVADISQCLLVLGPLHGLGNSTPDDEAKNFPLPKEVDKDFRYAHGLTPPMQWVRKRRFRKGVSYKDVEGVEDEVDRLLREDKECTSRGGKIKWKIYPGDGTGDSTQQQMDADMDMDAEGEYMDGYGGSEYGGANHYGATTPADGMQTPMAGQADDDEIDDADLLAGLEDLGDGDDADAQSELLLGAHPAAATHTDAMTRSSSAAAPGGSSSQAATPAADSADGGDDGPDEGGASSSDDDDDDDDDDDEGDDAGSMTAVDDDAVESAKELAAQREEVADLEREVANKRAELARVTNQLLKQRVRGNLQALEDELAMKRKAFGMDEDDDE